MKSGNQSFIIYVMLFIAIIAMVFFTVNQQAAGADKIPINQVATDLKAGKIDSIIEDDSFLEITYKNSDEIKTSTKDPNSPLVEQLVELGVQPEYLSADKVSIDIKLPSPVLGIVSVASYILPFLLLIGMFWFIFRQAQGSNNAAMSFGKSKARMFSGDHPTVTFEDVAGVDEAKEELQEVVEFLREPQKFIALGARIPKGVLLVGAPGTGKTLMAKAVSGEAGVPFFSISGSEFVEMFVGVGASRVRDLFEQAKRHSPAIVFVDEIDAVGRHRGAGLGGSHDEREQTLNQLLVEMDGFDTDTNVIIIAATNRPDILDPALLRPGRFDRRVVLDRPDIKGREQILNVHVKGKPVSPDVDLYDIARSTPGFVGADIENLVNEAAILAARRDKKIIEHSEFMEAIERVIAGPERKSRLINEDEKKIIAYHEAGHAVVLNALPEADTVQKVSIISRGDAGGYTMAFPEQDHVLKSRRQIMSDMIGLLGGRAAEEVVFNDITSGASNDLERVTKLARTMVMRLGMSEELGQMVYGKKEELVFLGREISEQRDYSEHIAEKIDTAIQNIVQDAYKRAKDILIRYREELDKIAKKLLEVETLDADAFYEIFPTPVEKNGGIPEIVNL
ncbi:MAG: ATP-dependent zinc metalloprotease FtsH [Brevefilum sp.]|nr:ATP-dependent zinc metalloprotease FtsH [Brevefilum sp.]MDT8380886.1 ATP-dependent zinc metalloprotease FtsH [Brevefilum sp.]MDW7755518.1 ATP-dependent zinc metalloprotease FtsH [Brevefilum sp.]